MPRPTALLSAIVLGGVLGASTVAGAQTAPAPVTPTATTPAATTPAATTPVPTPTPAAPKKPAVPVVPKIPAGVTAGGVDLSGLSVRQAAAKLKPVVAPQVAQDLRMRVAGRTFTLTAKTSKVTVNATKVAEAALAVAPGAPGAPVQDIPLVLTHDRSAVKAFAERIRAAVSRKGRDATGRITVRRIIVRRAKLGVGFSVSAARKSVDAALDDIAAPKVLSQKVLRTSPAVNANDIRKRYSTVITVDRANFKLRLFKNLKVAKTYGVAVGQPAYPTPGGLYAIQNKAVNPTWSVPNSPWAGELQGTTVEGGSAANPLKARWMGIVNGVGIHGTGEDYSIGSRASHGCIRMHVPDVIALFSRTPVGTPVLLG